MKPPGGECHDLWGASFNGSPSHLRVLKPPGGGSSDIFGTSAEPTEPQRKTRTHLTSSIFGEETVTPSRNKAGNDSFYNLFGNEPQVRPVSAFKDKTKSNIILDDVSTNTTDSDAKKSLTFTNEDVTQSGDSVDGEVPVNHDSVHTNGNNSDILPESSMIDICELTEREATKMPDGGNSAASNGPAVNGASSTSESSASTPAPTPAPATAAAAKQRVPPGGFSSGLW
ncbi:microtubule-associated protein Jupiter-like [Homalodisca vitripennis]|nr:microtubule-associated protein Jupiter-like isoform X3 [Homalodisca vitripennis]XP_046670012.1 microtubule-associated protein Jupiter-like [Homalodisca vitripennis]